MTGNTHESKHLQWSLSTVDIHRAHDADQYLIRPEQSLVGFFRNYVFQHSLNPAGRLGTLSEPVLTFAGVGLSCCTPHNHTLIPKYLDYFRLIISKGKGAT
jgi:hypothetical protein